MKKILFTGGTGFVGKNVLPILRENHRVIAPTRQELDLNNSQAVKNYVINGEFDLIIHSANPNPVKNCVYDNSDNMFEDCMRIFMNFYNVRDYYDRMLYLGSGAEFDKTIDMKTINEKEVHRSMPKDVYGCTKFIMNELSQHSENVYNLRLFACYGPYDHESKFITHVIRCCLEHEDITIRQNCYFDYLHVYDLAKIMLCFIEAKHLKYHDYNIASGTKFTLLEIAKMVREQMNSSSKIIILNEGWNKEYTADIGRITDEFNINSQFLDLSKGIEAQIEFEKINLLSYKK